MPRSAVTPPLSVLVVEDTDDDALLMVAHIRAEGREVHFQRVDTESALRAALRNSRWDAVLSDYVLPSFSGLAALRIVRQHDPDLPFLIVSGAIGEETAVEAMRAGAHDYIMKGNLIRLAPALDRELSEVVQRRGRRRAEAEREQLLVREQAARRQIEKSADQTARLLAVTAALSIAVTPADVAAAVVHHGAAALGACGGGVVMLREDGAFLQPLFSTGYPTDSLKVRDRLPLETNLPLATVVRTGEALWISSSDWWDAEHVDMSDALPGGTAAAVLPLLVHGRPIGGIEFIFERERSFADDDRAFIVVLAQQCAQALYRASLYESVRQSEARFQLQAHLLDAVGQAVVATDMDGIITYWNHGATRLFGYSAEEVTGRHVIDVLPTTASVDESRRVLYDLASGDEKVSEILIRRRDGTTVPILSHRMPIRNEHGTITGIIGVSSDITQLKQVGEALKESEQRFRGIFDQAAVGVAQSNLDGDLLLVNDHFVTLLGYTRAEALQKNFKQITHPDDKKENLLEYGRLLSGESLSYRLEKRYIRKDGTELWAEVTASIMSDRLGKPEHVLTVIADIDARKHAEAAVRASEQRYRALVETSPDGIALNDMNGVIVLANQQLAGMLGYDLVSDLQGTDLEAHLPEDERQRAREVLGLRAEGVPLTSVNTHYTVQRRDGSTFPAEISSFISPGASANERFITSTVRDVTDRMAYEAQLQHLALHDPLTDLANRTLLYDRLKQTLAVARRNKECVAVLLLDLDRFKEINDTFGHQVGDDVIREVGVRLIDALRLSDTLARMGGDEYVILLPETGLLGAVQTATRLTQALERPFDVGDRRLHVETSIGISLYPDHTEDPDTLLRYADVAMYSAKQANSEFAVYSVEQDSFSPVRLSLSGELREAIETDQLVLYYQPKMRLATGEIDGVEALVRWNHPEYGLIPPDQFIPLAEHSGLIRPLTNWVLDNALGQCRQWLDVGLNIGVAVNFSTRSLHDPDLPEVIRKLIVTREFPPPHLTVEITESVIMANPDHAMDMLGQLTDMGIKLSIDDFGTGYSSLAYLRHLRAHELKIDKSFVMDLDTNDENGFIVRSVIELGHNLGLQVVAEGVENQTTLDLLATLGCDRVQGYHLGRPQNIADMTAWLLQRNNVRTSRSRERSASACLIPLPTRASPSVSPRNR